MGTGLRESDTGRQDTGRGRCLPSDRSTRSFVVSPLALVCAAPTRLLSTSKAASAGQAASGTASPRPAQAAESSSSCASVGTSARERGRRAARFACGSRARARAVRLGGMRRGTLRRLGAPRVSLRCARAVAP